MNADANDLVLVTSSPARELPDDVGPIEYMTPQGAIRSVRLSDRIVTTGARVPTVELYVPRGITSIHEMKKGVRAEMLGQTVRLARPKFGFYLSSRDVEVAGPDFIWRLDVRGWHDMTLRRADGSPILDRDRQSLRMDPLVTPSEASLGLVSLAIARTSTVRYYLLASL